MRSVSQPGIILQTGTFAENLTAYHLLHRDPSDPIDPEGWKLVYSVQNPEARLQGVWIGGDLGPLVLAVIERWEEESWRKRLDGEVLVCAPYTISIAEMLETIKRGGLLPFRHRSAY